MKKSIAIIIPLVVLFNSCIGYKEPSKELTSDLKKNAKSTKNLVIPDYWILNNTDSINKKINLDWINEIKDNAATDFINEGLEYNADLNIANYRLEQVRLAMDIASANLLPTVGAGASSLIMKKGNRINQLALNANWEVDLWGKVKSNNEASKRDYFSAKYANERLKQSIEVMILQNYYLIVAGNVNILKISEFITKTEELKKLVEVRKTVGFANDTDVSIINAEIVQLKGNLEKIKNSNAQAKRALEMLMGRYPKGEVGVRNDFPEITSKVPETIDFQVLENRPDILASHYQIEKAFFEIQSAKAARLPSLNIGASLGAAFTSIAALDALYSNPLLNLSGGIVTPIFNAGRLENNLKIKNAKQQELIESYSKQVLVALNEVESAWTNIRSIEKQKQFTSEAIKELNSNVKLTKKQIEVGTSNYYVLIQKQREIITNEINLTNLKLQNILERINLYMALE